MIWPLGQSGPGALGSWEGSPTSSTPGWAQGAKKFDLMRGYVLCAELLELAEQGDGSPPSAAWWCAALEARAVTWNRVCCGPRSPLCPREARGGRPGPRLAWLLDRSHPRPSLVHGPWMWGWGWGRGLSRVPGGPLPIQNSSEPYFLPGLWAAVCPTGPTLSASLGHRPASSCGQASVPAGRKTASIIPQISALSWAEVEVGRRVAGSRGASSWLSRTQLAWGQGSGGRFQCFPPPCGTLRGPPAFLPYAHLRGIPHWK